MKIILISSAPLTVQAGGICQTLFNVFSYIDPQDILCVCPKEELIAKQPERKFAESYISYSITKFIVPRNRLGALLLPFASWMQNSILSLRKYNIVNKRIIQFNGDIVVVCPNSVSDIIMAGKLLKVLPHLPVIPYYMDDWMYGRKDRWLFSSLSKLTRSLLADNRYWMIIGNELKRILIDRYSINPREALVVRNPVSLDDAPARRRGKNDPFVIAYAGSLWEMHFDSFERFAKAVQIASRSKSVKLVLYTPEQFWRWRKDKLIPLDVQYRGNVAYNQIHFELSKADALLITSSFSPVVYTHSAGSVQTKMFDYSKSQRLIISCGPAYSANHQYLKENNAGVCIETDVETEIAGKITEVIYEYENLSYLVDNAWEVLDNRCRQDIVQANVQKFIANAVNGKR